MELRFGLLPSDLTAICNILRNYPAVKQAIIFGSRAKGNYRQGSDVDIALKGENLGLDHMYRISFELNEETNMPYKFDVLNYDSVNEPALKEHIDRIGIVFYSKGNLVEYGGLK